MKKIILLSLFIGLVIGGGCYFKKYNTYEYQHKGFFPLPILKPLWERKIPTEQDVRIGIITDNHVHAKRIDRENKTDEAPRYLNEKYTQPLDDFNKGMKSFKPNYIFQLGDAIEGTGDEDFVGIMGLELIRDELKKSGVPVYFAIGNHELRSINKEQFKEIFELEDTNQYFDDGVYRFIVLDSNCYTEDREAGVDCSKVDGNFSDKSFAWLEPLLDTDKHVFVFAHHPLFGKNNGANNIPNAGERLREAFGKYNVTAVFNGHVEKNYIMEQDGVKYYSFRGPKKSFKKQIPVQRPFYELKIDDAEPNVEMIYVSLDNEKSVRIDFEEEIDELETECREVVGQKKLEEEREEKEEEEKKQKKLEEEENENEKGGEEYEED